MPDHRVVQVALRNLDSAHPIIICTACEKPVAWSLSSYEHLPTLDEDRPLCTCEKPATNLVAVPGLLCDETGTVRTYTFCDEHTRLFIDGYRGAEVVGKVGPDPVENPDA